jgi:hypothetical protein
MKIGSFGDPAGEAEVEEMTFDYFGEELRVHPDLTDAELVDWLEQAATVKEDDPKAGALVKDFLRACVHPEDFEKFWTLGKRHRQSVEDRMKVANALLEAVTDRPTERPSGSPPGRGRTGMSSTADFASAAARRRADALEVKRRLEATGRADLAVAALRHIEHLDRTAEHATS